MERALQAAFHVIEPHTRERTDRRGGAAGFALLEVMMAACLLIAVAAGVSQLSATAVRASHTARARTMAALLAAQKMEQLRSLKWSRTRIGTPAVSVPVSDLSTDLSSDPPTGGGRGLLPSPAGTLDANVPLYVDYLDAAGTWAGRGATPPGSAVYVRRWAVQPLERDPDDILVLQVIVTTSRSTGAETAQTIPYEARLVSVLTRRP
jgi:hypothetical protein